jgi:hypothetical protein
MPKQVISDKKLSEAISAYSKETGWSVMIDPNDFFYDALKKILGEKEILNGKLPDQKHLVALALKNKDLQKCFSKYAAKMLAIELKDVFASIQKIALAEEEEDEQEVSSGWQAFASSLTSAQKAQCKELMEEYYGASPRAISR